MAADLAVRRVRLHSPVRGPSPRVHAELLLRNLAPPPGDHGVLIVRRLVLAGQDPADARRRLADLRRAAARPALGWVDPHAEAVLFADEAEALACLTSDLLSGTAAGRWWWQSRLPATGGRAGSSLTAAWLREIRWLPAALDWLEQRRPGDSVRAVTALTADQARAVLVALLGAIPEVPAPALAQAAVPSQATGPLSAAVHLEYQPPGAATEQPDAATAARWAQLVPTVAPSLPAENCAVLVTALVRAAEPASVAPQLLAFAASLPPSVRREPSKAPPTPLDPTPARLEPRRVVERSTARPGDRADARIESTDPPQLPADTVTPVQTDRPAAPGVADLPLVPADVAAIELWPGGLSTGHASALYLINLMLRYAPDDAGWDELGRFGRRVLRRRPGRRARARDPLWGMLAALSGQPRTSPPPAPEWWANALGFLRTRDIPAATFEQPGRVVITRTHLDVIMGLEQIDLAARVAGLDQDPSWVPQLGRIIAFHFVGGQP
jgi:hypothetical protein